MTINHAPKSKVTLFTVCIKVEGVNANRTDPPKKHFKQCSESSLLMSTVLVNDIEPKSEKTIIVWINTSICKRKCFDRLGIPPFASSFDYQEFA